MKSDGIARISVSLPSTLLEQFDEMVGEKGYDNRSLAVADMVRDSPVEHRLRFGNAQSGPQLPQIKADHRAQDESQHCPSRENRHPDGAGSSKGLGLRVPACVFAGIEGPCRQIWRPPDAALGDWEVTP